MSGGGDADTGRVWKLAGAESQIPQTWPNITAMGRAPADRDEWAKVKDKLVTHFSPNPGGKLRAGAWPATVGAVVFTGFLTVRTSLGSDPPPPQAFVRARKSFNPI